MRWLVAKPSGESLQDTGKGGVRFHRPCDSCLGILLSR